MHARTLVEIAAEIAWDAPESIRTAPRIRRAALQRYWAASRTRLDRWTSLIHKNSALVQLGGALTELAWRIMHPILEEVLASEILSRVFVAAAAASDQRRREIEAEPIARSILAGHLEARNRALRLLTSEQGPFAAQQAALNQLRLKTERWSDLLLAHLADVADVAPLAFDTARLNDFACDHRTDSAAGKQRRLTQELMLASLRDSFGQSLRHETASADLNHRIGEAAREIFAIQEGHGKKQDRLLPDWLIEMSRTADNAQQMIDELVDLSHR